MAKPKPRNGWRVQAQIHSYFRLSRGQRERIGKLLQAWDPDTRQRDIGFIERWCSQYLQGKAQIDNAPKVAEQRAALQRVLRAAKKGPAENLSAALGDVDELALLALYRDLCGNASVDVLEFLIGHNPDEIAPAAERVLAALPRAGGRPLRRALQSLVDKLARLYQASRGVMTAVDVAADLLGEQIFTIAPLSGWETCFRPKDNPAVLITCGTAFICAQTGIYRATEPLEVAARPFSFDWYDNKEDPTCRAPVSPGASFVVAVVQAVDPSVSLSTLRTAIRKANEKLKREREELAGCARHAPAGRSDPGWLDEGRGRHAEQKDRRRRPSESRCQHKMPHVPSPPEGHVPLTPEAVEAMGWDECKASSGGWWRGRIDRSRADPRLHRHTVEITRDPTPFDEVAVSAEPGTYRRGQVVVGYTVIGVGGGEVDNLPAAVDMLNGRAPRHGWMAGHGYP